MSRLLQAAARVRRARPRAAAPLDGELLRAGRERLAFARWELDAAAADHALRRADPQAHGLRYRRHQADVHVLQAGVRTLASQQGRRRGRSR